MPRSTSKVILFSRVTVDRKTHQWPTAVFNDHGEARAYATMLRMAHQSASTETAKTLDPHTALDGDGKLIPGVKFSIAEVPYQPQPNFADGDVFDDDKASTL